MKSDILPVSTISSKNENLTKKSGIDVKSLATPTAHDTLYPHNSLEMNSPLTRDILHQSDNQLADLGSINEYLAHRKRIVIDQLMALVDDWLENNPAFARHAQEGSASASQDAASEEGVTPSPASHSAGEKPRQKRALQANGTDGSGSNGDENGGGKRGSKRSRTETPLARKFACPFFKNNPSNYKDKQACTGPGWLTISRVKEHIFRCHWQEHKCVRCYIAFKDAGELEEHQRADEPCRKSSPRHDEGITESQHIKLKKKSSTAKPDAERWQAVYRIVFPDAKSSIPSPFYEYGEGNYVQGCSKDTLEFGEYVREELPQRVRNELEERYSQFDNEIRMVFVSLVKSIVGDLTKNFKEQQQQHSQPPAASNGGSKSAARTSGPPGIEGTSSSSPSSSASCPNPTSYLEYDCFQFLSQDGSLPFLLDDGGDMPFFDCRLSPNLDIHAGLPNAGNLDDSAHVSLEGSTGSPASFKSY